MDGQFAIDDKTKALLAAHPTVTEQMSFIEFKDKNGRNIRSTMECEQSGDLLDSEYGHSILCTIIDDASLSNIENIEDLAASLLPETIEFKPLVKDQKFFLKLKQKGDKYKAIIDPPCPTTVEKTLFLRGSNLTIDYTLSMWINYKNNMAGLFLNVSKITIDGGRRKSIKRR